MEELSPFDLEEQRMRDGSAEATRTQVSPEVGVTEDTESPFDVAAREQNALRQSLEQASKVNPDEAAEIQRIARETGISPDAVTEYKDVILQREEARLLEEQLKDKPVLSRVMRDPRVAPLAKDEVKPLGEMETIIAGLKSGWNNLRSGAAATQMAANERMLSELKVIEDKLAKGEQVAPEDDPAGFAQATPEFRATLREDLERAAADAVLRSAEFSRRGQAEMAKVDQSVVRALQSETFGEFWKHFTANPLEFLAVLTSQQLSQNLPTFAGAIGGGLIGGAPGAAIGGGAASYGNEYGASILQALGSMGVDVADPKAIATALEDPAKMAEVRQIAHTRAQAISTLDAAGVGAGSRIFAPRALGAPGVGKTVARETANLTAQAGIQGVTGAAGEAVATELVGGDQKAGELMAEALGGGGMAVGSIASNAIAQTRQELKAQAKQRDQVKALIDAAAGSKFRERDPQAFHRFIEEAAAEGFDQVYVDGAVLNQLMQEGGEQAQAALAQMPEVAAQMQEAVFGSDVAIPVADLATHIAGTPMAEVLVDHIRRTENGKSYAELEQQAAQIEAEAEQEAAKQSEPEKWDESRQRVSDAVYSQMIATGNVGHEQARISAALTSAMFATQAGRLGKMPHELAAEYNLTILDETQQTPAEAWNMLVKDFEAAKARGDTAGARRIQVQLQDLESKVKKVEMQQDATQTVTFDEELAGAADKAFKGLDVMTQSTMTDDIMGVIPGKPLQMDTPQRAEQAAAAREAFNPFRELLRQRHGDEVILWRADSPRKSADSRTVFFGDERVAGQYSRPGGEAREARPYRVRVDDIEHAMVGPDGTLHQIAARIPEGGLVPAESAVNSSKPAVLNQAFGARFATGPNAATDPTVDTDGITLDHMRESPATFEKNVGLISKYAGMPPHKKGLDAEGKTELILEFMTDNLLWIYDQIPAEIRERSKLWYVGANRIATQMATRYGVEMRQMAVALAALSPQRDWFQNVSLAERIADVVKNYADVKWDHKMDAAADSLIGTVRNTKKVGKRVLSAAEIDERVAAMREKVAAIKGKTYAEARAIDVDLAAQYVRVWDKARNPGSYRIVTPEGAFAGFAMNADKVDKKGRVKKGEPTSIGWGGNDTIANAIIALETNSVEVLNRAIGQQHKVRNFYNNIYNPGDPRFSTIDTHAVAALWLQPFGGSDTPVSHNLGGGSSSAPLGVSGTYAFGQDAHQLAALARDVLPREMQSITWEAVRGLFVNKSKPQKERINAIWQKFSAGELSADEARAQVLDAAGGFRPPEWADGSPPAVPGTVDGQSPDSGENGQERGLSYERPLPVSRVDAGGAARPVSSGIGGALAGGVPAEDRQPLAGLPARVNIPGVGEIEAGPFATAHRVARAAAERIGVPYRPIRTYQKVVKERAARIAQAYDEMEHRPNDPEVRAAYDAMIRETLIQYEEIMKTGLVVEFIDFAATGDPYAASPRLATEDIRNNNHMWVFATDDGFGSSEADISGNPLLAETKHFISGRRALANDIFRVVHDYFGHVQHGLGFRADGEENAWRSHSAMYSPLARRAMTSETRGQNSWVNYGPHGDKNRTASAEDTVFADQKTGLLPDWVVTEGAEDPPAPVSAPESVAAAPVLQQSFPRIESFQGMKLRRPTADVRVSAASAFADGPFKIEPGVREVPLADLELQGEQLYTPGSEHAARVDDLAAKIRKSNSIEPLFVAQRADGSMYVAEGGHRARALKALGYDSIPAKVMVDGAAKLEQSARGTITFGQGIAKDGGLIRLLRGADASTFMHELGHFYLEMLTDIATQPNAPPAVLSDMLVVLTWLGEDPATWASKSIEERRESHEKFARGFEAYLFEGKAPIPELKGAFARFRAWMLQVYRSLTDLNVTLTDEVRGVFDRMLANNDQLQEAAQKQSQAPLFNTPEEAGMTPEEWAAYRQTGEESTRDAINQMDQRRLKDMKWLGKAKSALLRKLQDEAKDKRAAVEAEVRTELEGEPVALAARFIRTGELPETPNNAAVRDALDLLAGGKTKLSTPLLREIMGDGPAAPWRYLPPNMIAAQDGADPDVVAQVFGFKSGEQMVKAILANDIDKRVEEETDVRMLERFGDINSPDALENAVSEALANAAHVRFTATELAVMQEAMSPRKQVGTAKVTKGKDKGKDRAVTVNAIIDAAKRYADKAVARAKIRNLKPGKYTAAANRAAAQSASLFKAGDIPAAIDAKRNQVLNSRVARAMAQARDESQAIVTKLQKLATSPPESIDVDYRDQIAGLLERFNLTRLSLKQVDRRKALAEWIEQQRDLGIEPPLSPEMADEAFRTHYTELTMEQLRDLEEAVDGVVHLGKLKKKLLTAKDEREYATVIADMVESIEKHGGKKRKRQYTPTKDSVKLVKGFFADHRKLGSLLRQMDGGKDGGVLWERFMRPLNEAADLEASMREKSTEAIAKILAPVMKKRGGLGRKVLVASIGEAFTLEQRIAVALNQGNEGNKQRLRDGHGWSNAQVQDILATLDRTDWLAVQAIWDHIDSHWQPIAEKTRRVGGSLPQKIDAEPFDVALPDGTTVQLRGGYYPAAADTELSTRAGQHNEAEVAKNMLRGAYAASMTRRGHLKERAKVSSEPLMLALDPLFRHLNDVSHDLAFHEWLIDANRMRRDPRFANAVRDYYGPEMLKVINDAVHDIAVGDSANQTTIERALMRLRANVSAATMGLSLTTALLQPFGLTQSVVRIGPRYVFKGMASALADPFKAVEQIGAKSEFMRLRAKTMNRELSEIHGRVKRGRQWKAAEVFDASKFMLMQKMQLLADVPTWLGAEAKALAEGNDAARAIALADQAVIDAQGSGMVKDLARVQRGGALAKMMTIFYSYFSTTYNLTAEQAAKRGRQVKEGHIVSAALGAATDAVLLYVIPALGPALVLDLLKGGEPPEDEEEWFKWMAKKLGAFAIAPIVYLRELGGLFEGYSYSGPAGFRLVGDVGAVVKQAQQGEADQGARTAALKTLGSLTGLPTTQLDRTIKGWEAYMEDDAPITSILFGPPPKQ